MPFGFLNLSTIGILGQVILCGGRGGGCPVIEFLAASVLDASGNSPSPNCDNQKCLQVSLGGRESNCPS